MKNQWLPFIFIIILAVFLAFVARDFMNQAIVSPLLYFFWVGRLLFDSIPQEVIWGIFLIVAVIMAWSSLAGRRQRRRRVHFARKTQPGRIETWHKLIRQADQETYYKWKLAQNLRNLTLGALAYEERLPMRLLRRRLTNDDLEFPPEVQAYFQASATSFGYFTRPKLRFFQFRNRPSPLDLAPEKIVQFLEEKFIL